jgi:hypothetical protein
LAGILQALGTDLNYMLDQPVTEQQPVTSCCSAG